MKTHLILLIALLGFACPAYGQTTSVPQIISDGFATYKTDGAAKAVDVWFAGSAIGNTPATKASFVTYLTTFETNNGKFSGYETIGSVTLSPSVTEYYLTVLYASYPLYLWFEVYTTGGKSIITTLVKNK